MRRKEAEPTHRANDARQEAMDRIDHSLPDGSHIVRAWRPEDGRWHLKRVRADGFVMSWLYAESLTSGRIHDSGSISSRASGRASARRDSELPLLLPAGVSTRALSSSALFGLRRSCRRR